MSKSHYSKYLTERTGDHILEHEYGFATYRFLEDEKTVYIIDIFVLEEHRKTRLASKMADEIVEKAKAKGCTKLIGSVVPSMKNSTASLTALVNGYKMTLDSATNDFILFKKEI